MGWERDRCVRESPSDTIGRSRSRDGRMRCVVWRVHAGVFGDQFQRERVFDIKEIDAPAVVKTPGDAEFVEGGERGFVHGGVWRAGGSIQKRVLK